jgi:hypothetical protein
MAFTTRRPLGGGGRRRRRPPTVFGAGLTRWERHFFVRTVVVVMRVAGLAAAGSPSWFVACSHCLRLCEWAPALRVTAGCPLCCE